MAKILHYAFIMSMTTSIEAGPFYFIRHGETDWNVEGRAMGQTDIVLNAKGLSQAAEAAQNLLKKQADGPPIQTICHSPLARAKQTAQILSDTLGVALVECTELRECAWGAREGQTRGPWREEWFGGVTPPGAESYENFLQRALLGVQQALQRRGPVLLVSHGGVYWAIQRHFTRTERVELLNCQTIYHEPPEKPGLPWRTRQI